MRQSDIFEKQLAEVVVRLPDQLEALRAVVTVGHNGLGLNLFAIAFHICLMLLRRMGGEHVGGIMYKALRCQGQIAPGGRAQGG